jgi:iduronate 2-sulfatase
MHFSRLVVFLCWTVVAAYAPAAADKPNVLFIAIDDLGTALGCYGHPLAHTPHIDRLAATGVRFDRAYNQLPLCNPSRASVLTGLRPDKIKVYDLDRHFRDELPDVVTLPQAFRRGGWRTERVGKIYHYDVPRGIGTDGLDDPPSWDAVFNPRGRDVADESRIVNPTPARPVSAALSWLAADGTDEEQTDGMIATEAIGRMTANRERAFFIAAGFFRPHTPFVAPKKYFDLYPLEKIKLPSAPGNDRDDIPPVAFAHNNLTPHYGLDEETCRRALQAYYASVAFVDAQVGRLLRALDELQLARRTIVVLWSDHGYHLGEHHGVWQKRMLFEESTRTPLIIRDPRARGNGRPSPAIVELVDIFPTLADLAGIAAPRGLAGRTLKPLLDEPTTAWEGNAFSQVLRPNNGQPVMGRSVRTERWRYTEWGGGAAGAELYDHERDPHEFVNLATDPAHAPTRARLRTLFENRITPDAPLSPVNPARL